MNKIKRLLLVIISVVCLISFSGCSTTEKISVDDIDPNNIKVRVDMCGGYSLVQYVTILTNDNRVISFDGHNDTAASVVPLEDSGYHEVIIKQSLDSLQECESEDVDYYANSSDLYYIEMYIGDKTYSFTYGCAKNPDANILTEVLLSYSEVEGLEDIIPYPSSVRRFSKAR